MCKSKQLIQSSSAFRWLIYGTIFFALISLFRTIFGWLNVFLEPAPNWFFNITFAAFIALLISIYGILQLKRWAVFLYPLALLFEFFLYALYGNYLIDAVTGIFFYIGFGLIAVIENWRKFT